MNNWTINLTNFNSTAGQHLSCLQTSNRFDAECLYSILCPQMNNYFINIGITIIIFYLIMSWVKWYFLRYGYKRILHLYNPEKSLWKYIGNLDILETRAYWDMFITSRLLKLTIGFIVVVVWFHIKNSIM